MGRTYVDIQGFGIRSDQDIADPPYVYGDHAALCLGCRRCDELEDAYFAEQGGLAESDQGGE